MSVRRKIISHCYKILHIYLLKYVSFIVSLIIISYVSHNNDSLKSHVVKQEVPFGLETFAWKLNNFPIFVCKEVKWHLVIW